ncbi:hypothetical protein NA57DRAFT_58327 [Rhizodiscina lignyota]|uniref:Uncharacterized protein n=1 Tax=Rhizodiscina lignyota TaxID=1504668 RepID=A0A9P4I755_9PEZI|nr:hypothetical protein NA57DRAFT_58327 [Rhizodiscina lignyota]
MATPGYLSAEPCSSVEDVFLQILDSIKHQRSPSHRVIENQPSPSRRWKARQASHLRQFGTMSTVGHTCLYVALFEGPGIDNEEYVWGVLMGPSTKHFPGPPLSYEVNCYWPRQHRDALGELHWKVEATKAFPLRIQDWGHMLTRFIVATVDNVDAVKWYLESKVGRYVSGETELWVEGILASLFELPAHQGSLRSTVLQDFDEISETAKQWTKALDAQGRFAVDHAQGVPTRDLMATEAGDGLKGDVYIK